MIKYKIKFFGHLNGAKALNMTFFLDGHLEFGNQQNFPIDTSIVAFTGKPDPDDVLMEMASKKTQIYKKIYKQLKTPQWVLDNWL